MAIDQGTFETLSPSRFLTFSFPNPLQLGDDLLRIAVLDSPRLPDSDPRVAALLVPQGREHDWLFSSGYGHLQLLLAVSPALSRLVLVGNPSLAEPRNATYTRPSRRDDLRRARFEEMLLPLLLALSPKSAFKTGIPDIPFLVYEDNVFRSVPVEVCNGPAVGEMLVEDVEIEMSLNGEESVSRRELRRRLRFKRMPNLVQTQMRIVLADREFGPDTRVLVQPYLQPMVASLSLIVPYFEECIRLGSRRPRVLCLGIGGGALLSFLRAHLGFFDILGVEMDEAVLQMAHRYFGLVEDEFLRVYVGDGIRLIQNLSRGAISWNAVYGKLPYHSSQKFADNTVKVELELFENLGITCKAEAVRLDHDLGGRQCAYFGANEMEQCLDDLRKRVKSVNSSSFSSNSLSFDLESKDIERDPCEEDVDSLIDVVMVDLDSSDATNGQSAPPLEFVGKSVLLDVRSVLHKRGILVLNVIVSRSDSFYVSLVAALQEVFSELYELDIGNGENYVLVATVSPVVFVALESEGFILKKLKEIINGVYIERLRKI